MTKEEREKVERFRNAVERFLTSASNPGRAAAVVHDNTSGSPYHDLVIAKIDIDAMLCGLPFCVLVDPKMPADTMHFSCGPRSEQNVTVTGLAVHAPCTEHDRVQPFDSSDYEDPTIADLMKR